MENKFKSFRKYNQGKNDIRKDSNKENKQVGDFKKNKLMKFYQNKILHKKPYKDKIKDKNVSQDRNRKKTTVNINNDMMVLPSGIKAYLRMKKLTGKNKADSIAYQKSNPIPPSTYNSYPKDALPKIILPNISQELISSSSKKKIEELYTALDKGSSDEHVSFDEALELLRASENLQEGEDVLYLGGGKFGVVSYEEQDKKKRMNIIRTIDFESASDVREWRNNLQYAVQFIKIEEVRPLSELYTQSEINSFAEFNNN